jgi:adenosylhomocysteine nucleosidase
MIKIAVVAALEREVKPLVRRWRMKEHEHEGRRYRFFENGPVVVVSGGIGAEAARRATEAVIRLYAPSRVWSVGFAGGLDPAMKVGDGFRPRRVFDASDGSRVETDGEGTLVSYDSVVTVDEKRKLGQAYHARAVDMEAAAVARGAQARGVEFGAYKVISDESDFELPAIQRFIQNGEFRTLAFMRYTVIRPWLWPRVIRLARNSSRATETLCHWLAQSIAEAESLESKPRALHPMKRA